MKNKLSTNLAGLELKNPTMKNYQYLLKELGFVYDVQSGFQFDLNTVLQKTRDGYTEGHWCNNNCTTDCGNYDCPGAFSRNKGIKPETAMSFGEIKKSLINAKKGMEIMNKMFLKNIFPGYVKEFKIPSAVAKILHQTLENGDVELNIFGGNPELHSDFLKIISAAKKIGWRVCTTTTGKRFLAEPDFLEKFIKNPPHLMAISCDDFENIDELKRLLSFSLKKIKTLWFKVNPLYGQRKKAHESIYVAKLAKKTPGFCRLLFNIVVHSGNLSFIEKIIGLLTKKFPAAIINPYLAQSSFSFRPGIWKAKHLPKLEKFVNLMIRKQLEQVGKKNKVFVPRLKFWLFMKSTFLTIKNKNTLLKNLSGYNLWQCFAKPGAGRYLQVGCLPKKISKKARVGGHPGCFWNDTTVTDKRQLWQMKPKQIADYILKDKPRLAKRAKRACPGCIMPRLLFDGISTELGMNSKLLPAYLKLRKQYFKF